MSDVRWLRMLAGILVAWVGHDVRQRCVIGVCAIRLGYVKDLTRGRNARSVLVTVPHDL